MGTEKHRLEVATCDAIGCGVRRVGEVDGTRANGFHMKVIWSHAYGVTQERPVFACDIQHVAGALAAVLGVEMAAQTRVSPVEAQIQRENVRVRYGQVTGSPSPVTGNAARQP